MFRVTAPSKKTVAVSVSVELRRWFNSPVALVSAMAVMAVGLGSGGGVTGVSLSTPPPPMTSNPMPAAMGVNGKNAMPLSGLSKATLQSRASSFSVQIKLSDTLKVSSGKLAVT